MKKTIIHFVISLFLINFCFAQNLNQITETQKLSSLIKVWGFLKYFHSEVAKGNIDWDREFMNRIKELQRVNSKEELSNYYSEWISSLGEIKKCKKCKNDYPDSLKFNLDLKWLNDTTQFTTDLFLKLQYILQNRNQDKNFYVQQVRNVGNTSYENEKSYNDSIFPSVEMRLLGLARYWNIIDYFYPYKYKIDQNWNDVLIEMIPKFEFAKDTIEYHFAMLELVKKINDSHAEFGTKYIYEYSGLKYAPFNYKIIDNKAIVIGFYNDSLCKKDDIQNGDAFLKVNNVSIEQIIKEKSKYVGGSNYAAQLRNFSFYGIIFQGQTDFVNVTLERDGKIIEKNIRRYIFYDFGYQYKYAYYGPGIRCDTSQILNGNIGYVNMGILQQQEVDKTMNNLKNTKAIIFDVRNYPKGTMYKIAEFLNPDKKSFAKFTYPDLSYPGFYYYTEPYYCGKENKDYYKGKVVLLFNENSQSHAEFTLMALQTAPDVISIGSQTAGADGNVSLITFPGGYETYMTGLGVYYPDGRETQRVGIKPDIVVHPTLQGIKEERDEVLERAILYLKTGK